MADKKKRKKKKHSVVNWKFVFVTSIILSICVIITMADYFTLPSFVPTWDDVKEGAEDLVQNVAGDYDIPIIQDEKELRVHYIDVGQGDSILIQYDGKNALIDAGISSKMQTVDEYLQNNAVEKIDVLIVSHPDSDHIGGMSGIIDRYDIGEIYMPPVSEDLVPTSKVYINMLTSISTKGLQITLKEAGDKIPFGNLEFICVAPEGEFSSLNNSSLCLRLVHGENSFLFTGDMEKSSERVTLQKGYDVSATVLKVGHHGASGSSTEAFLDAVSPEYAVISVGEGNRYDHPNESVLKALEERKIKIYRTDWNGNVVIVSDGVDLAITTQK